jgi:hypothetical protein
MNNAEIRRAVEYLRPSADCVLPVPYELYMYNPKVAMRLIHTFLNLPHEDHAPDFAKATGDSLCNVIINWEDVCQYFAPCTQFQIYLNDWRNKCFCRGNYSMHHDTNCLSQLSNVEIVPHI